MTKITPESVTFSFCAYTENSVQHIALTKGHEQMNNINSKDLSRQLSSLSDDELHSMITAVCAAAGVSAEKTAELTSDIPRLRRMLNAMSDRRISALLSTLGVSDVSEILRKLGDSRA